jgi:chaperone modulatory protein CbpM
MNDLKDVLAQCVLVESELHFSLTELSQVCHVNVEELVALVHEGVLTPVGADPTEWRFEGKVLPRARIAIRLLRDLELNAQGAALVLDLLDEMASLRSQLHRLGR